MNRLPDFRAGIVLCLCAVLAVLSAENFAAVHVDHDCRGEVCPVCLWIQGVRLLAGQPRHTAFPFSLPPGSVLIFVLVSRLAALRPAAASSVKLKVKMNK
jgi:hypothetical protein